MEKRIIFDWLTFTTKKDSINSIKSFMGFDEFDFEEIKGRYGYTKRLFYDGINIYFGGSEDMGICVELSGKGCRNFEKYGSSDYYELFSYLISNSDDCHITRLDVAFDDFDGILDFNVIADSIANKQYLSRFREFHIERTYSKDPKFEDFCIYCGSRQSETLFRIYDKKAEQERFDLEHWLRFELQLRRSRAECFVNLLLSDNDISDLFVCVINNYLRFVVPSESDTNKSRAVTCEWWFNFLQTFQKVSLCLPDDDYTESRLERFVKKQTSSAIVAFIALNGFNAFRDVITGKSKIKLNQKYMNLLKSHNIFNLEDLFSNEWWLEPLEDKENDC